jgi:hypothetical protein
MSICSNPKERRIRVPVGTGAVILILRHPTNDEYLQFIGSQFRSRRSGAVDENSMQARVDFTDQLLIGIEGRDPDGGTDCVTYIDPDGGEEKPLTPEVPCWKTYVRPSWKIAASMELEGDLAETEDNAAKN